MSGYKLGKLSQQLSSVKEAFGTIDEPPFCSGTVPFSGLLFYRSIGGAGAVNFSSATEEELASLASACQRATFGVEQKDVLDESYRKAGKMDPSEFATQFSVTPDMIDAIRDTLLQSRVDQRPIRVELYKLNVYGPGSFFKAHVDTPRDDKMFGSLVVVLPTVHEGGSLIFRHRGQEHTLDTAKAVSVENSPQAAFIAFYSDIEHEVSVVTSGYRVTLTYNLYFSELQTPRTAFGIMPKEDPLSGIKEALSALLDDEKFLPHGGFLGFGLSHKYPFNPQTTHLEHLLPRLKGSDADILKICDSLSLRTSLKAIYHHKFSFSTRKPSRYFLADDFIDLDSEMQVEYDIVDYLQHTYDGTRVYDPDGPASDSEAEQPIVWIKSLTKSNSFREAFVAFGNDATLDFAWGDVCLVAEVNALGKESDSESEHMSD